ncbi:MAG: RDD family protein [Gammaproteobacteria bacterium]|nr:RDD family protein [Gammaproteobacteria bacterium]
MNIAGLGRRIIGGLIDLVLVFLFSYFYVVLVGEKMADRTYHMTGFSVLILMLIVYLYFVILEATTGKTVGKYIARMKVVNEKGQKISWWQSIVRNFIRVVDALFFYLIGLIAILLTKKNQRLGDMVAKTYVIRV